MKLTYVVKDTKYETVKQLLKEEFQLSERLLLKLKSNEKIFRNGQIVSVHSPLLMNDTIEVFLDLSEDSSNIVPIEMNLNIIYEDDALLIINKEPGVPIHPSRAHYEDSLSNGISYYFNKIGLKKKIRPVNRLDKDTSGIVIFAKNEYIQECLIKQMKQQIFKKEYLAIVEGLLQDKSGSICLPIARKAGSIIEREVPLDGNGDTAITHYSVLKEDFYSNLSLLHIILETGRTHQIRVHFSYLSHPLLGDTLYGNSSNLIARQALHAYKITFVHPITKKIMEFSSPIPEDMQKIIPNFKFL